MKLYAENNIEDVLKDKVTAIVAIPYSLLDDEVRTWVIGDDVSRDCMVHAVGMVVDSFIKSSIHSVYIIVYNTDAFNRTNTNAERAIKNKNNCFDEVETLTSNLFNAFVEAYNRNNYVPNVQANYIRTRKGITKTILTNAMFVSSRRTALKVDARKEDITYNDSVKEFAKDKMSKVLCCIIAPDNILTSESIEESAYERCLYDILQASFIPNENVMVIVP